MPPAPAGQRGYVKDFCLLFVFEKSRSAKDWQRNPAWMPSQKIWQKQQVRRTRQGTNQNNKTP